MTVEELKSANYWCNEQYFDYMKETGEWEDHGDLGITGKPCDRCEQNELGSWKVEAFFNIIDPCTKSYTVGTEFEICLMCMMELYSAT